MPISNLAVDSNCDILLWFISIAKYIYLSISWILAIFDVPHGFDIDGPDNLDVHDILDISEGIEFII